MFFSDSSILNAILATFLAGFVATSLGAIPAFFLRKLNPKLDNNLLSFAAGVMLAATIFSLLLPGIDRMEAAGSTKASAVLQAVIFLFIGGFVIWAINEIVPHAHFEKMSGPIRGYGGLEGSAAIIDHSRLRKIWLFVIAIAIHNFPEGMAVGVSSATGEMGSAGIGATLGIALQNIPEGLSVAVALQSLGYSKLYAFVVTALTGLVEIFGGIMGASVLMISSQMLPWALAFSAGAMLFIVSDEIIPETHRPGFENGATFSLFVGFGLMLYLDTVLGQ